LNFIYHQFTKDLYKGIPDNLKIDTNKILDKYLEATNQVNLLNISNSEFRNIINSLRKKNKSLRKDLMRYNSSVYSFLNCLVLLASNIYRMNLSLFKAFGFLQKCENTIPTFTNFEVFLLTIFWTILWLVRGFLFDKTNIYIMLFKELIFYTTGLSLLYSFKLSVNTLLVYYFCKKKKDVC